MRYFMRSEDSSFYALPFGQTGDAPAPDDYHGDGKFNTAVLRSNSAARYVQNSRSGLIDGR